MAHLPGKFVWFELNTKDIDRAARFYGELFGWKLTDASMNGHTYHMISNGEAPIGGFTALENGHPHWISYLSVDDVDSAVKRAEKNGGQVLKEAMDYPTVGRFALLADPQGGRFFAFKNEKEDAPDRETKAGDWFWNELWTSDREKASTFYQESFGVKARDSEVPNMQYTVLEAGGIPRAGVMTSPVPGIPVNWLPYVRVEKVDELVKRAKKLGAEVMSEPQDIPSVGRFAILKDQDGAAIAVITPTGM
jgi:uncharacterized protein